MLGRMLGAYTVSSIHAAARQNKQPAQRALQISANIWSRYLGIGSNMSKYATRLTVLVDASRGLMARLAYMQVRGRARNERNSHHQTLVLTGAPFTPISPYPDMPRVPWGHGGKVRRAP